MKQLLEQVKTLRAFNRFYTQQIGTLDEGLVGTEYSLTEARLLFELASADRITAADLSLRLGLDAGYLSRTLAKLHSSGLIRKHAEASDRRQTLLSLSVKGARAFAILDERSTQQARALLAPLKPTARTALASAMRSIEEILTAPNEPRARSYVLRTHETGDMGWVVERHAALYAHEYGWNEQFEVFVARLAADFLEQFDPAKERCWIAEDAGERLGCVFLMKHRKMENAAQLRMLLVDPAARGLGLGKTLVNQCTRFARKAGYRKITLWTNSILGAARHLYEQEGYVLIHQAEHHSFGKPLIEQSWELDLQVNN